MATTTLLQRHAGEGETIAEAIRDCLDYGKNPEKTESGKYISAYECDPATVADGTTETVMNSAPLEEKMKAFNFNVVTIDGHDYDQIEAAMQAFHAETAKPTCIIMDTTKGKGVSYMTNSVDWHGKGPNDDEYKIAIEELNAAYAALEQEEN